ncbi:proprotein convertase subtilisin kexin type 7 [Limosa lapponica baueri]|uniref:Proprotein convertase subtilisin kexin type 7 n=1 Tax=Limosa lapponica baueri TaxID=1758121 RepID=A0A2I0TBK3_LIMLA|nr:proprotein convertase subtilisin kexin type 7 [Limosa lapponica baueri]
MLPCGGERTAPSPQAALQHGVIAGRRGFGSIFVVASGNGGQHNDNCNYDGYANSIYTVTIGAVDETGSMPFYAEECASMLAVTFSGGDKMMRSIVTTDWDLQKGTGCTEGHTGTSAAAPLAAGMIALMLQVRPCLTWRDVQHIIVFTATKIWESVPYLASYVSPVLKEGRSIPLLPQELEVSWNGDDSLRPGTLKQWQLTLYGSSWSPAEMKDRQRLLEEAMSGQYLSSNFSLPCPPGLEIPEEQRYTITANTLKTLLLLGCFAVFWTFYYMLEVCLTRNNVGLDLGCNGSTACHWYQQGGKHRALESGLEMESVPLYREKDIEDVEMECEHPQPAREDEGQEGSWTPSHPKLSSRATSFHEAAPAGAGYLGQEVTTGLLLEDREHQQC